jgi:hypothetical protein
MQHMRLLLPLEFALCKLVVITAKMPVQVQTNHNYSTVQPARTFLEQRLFGINGQRAKCGWLIGSQDGKQQR